MGFEEGSYCDNCGLANWKGICPHCSGEGQEYEQEQEPDRRITDG